MAVRLAIIGLGAAARTIHLPAYAQLGSAVEIVAATDVDSDARSRAAPQLGTARLYDDPARMIEATRPDVVSICTPPGLHHEQTLLALAHACHVFCEKPLTENLPQTDDIIRASAAAGRHVVVNTQFPCMRIHAAAKAQIGTPAFGRLLFLHACQSFRTSAATESGWRSTMQRRVCLEFGIHVFELVRFFFDATPSRIYCHMPQPVASGAAESINIISLEFADGRAASIVLDRLSKAPDRYLDMTLDGEFASVHTSIGGELRFEVGVRTRERRPFWGLHVVKGGKAVRYNGSRSTVLATDGMNPFAAATAVHFSAFLAAIATGQTPAGTAADHRKTLGLALAAYDSAESRQVVDLRSSLGA